MMIVNQGNDKKKAPLQLCKGAFQKEEKLF